METKTITIERTFDAPLDRVWDAWTDPDEVQKWWGPDGWTAPEIHIDFRVGGTFLGCMRGAMEPGGPVMDIWSGGVYEEIIPMEKIVSTDYFADDDGNKIDPKEAGMPGDWPEELRVTVTFTDLGDGKTKVTLTHVGHPPDIVDDAKAGWNQSLDKLAASLV